MATNARGTGALTAAFVEEVRSLLFERRMTQADLVRTTGIPRATMSSIMNARTHIDLEQIEAIAEALDVHPSELMKSSSERKRLTASNAVAQDSDLGPLVQGPGSVTARSTDEQHRRIEEWAEEFERQAPESSTPTRSESSSSEDRRGRR